MKTTEKMKQKAEKKRQKILKKYYKAYKIGEQINIAKSVRCFVLGKHQLDNDYYFVVQDLYGDLYLQKLIYKDRPCIVNVSREGRQYAKNCDVFDAWIEQAKIKRNKWIKTFYNNYAVGDFCKGESYTLALKKEYNGDYYFVLWDKKYQYKVAKLVSWYTNVYIGILGEEQLASEKTVFNLWIKEAKA